VANLSTHLDEISSGQSAKEVTANDLFDALSPAALFGRRALTTSGFTWGYYGGTALMDSGAYEQFANGTLTLAASSTNYVEFEPEGSPSGVFVNQSGFTAGRRRLYTVTTDASGVTNYIDWRAGSDSAGSGGSGGSLSPYTLGSGTTAITHAAHANRYGVVNQAGATTGTFAASATSGALEEDWFYLRNTGAGTFTAAGAITAPTGFKLTAAPNEVFTADYDSVDDHWYSTTPSSGGVSSVNSQTGVVVLNADQIELPDPEGVFGSPQSVGAGMRELEARITAGGGATTLAGLTDVDLNESPSQTHGDLLMYDATLGKWVAMNESMKIFNVSWAATILIDLEKRPDNAIFRITLGGATTVNIRGARDGQKVTLEFTQDATGSRVVTLSSDFAFGTDITSFTASTTAGVTDHVGVVFTSAAAKYRVLAVSKGY